MFEVLKGGEHQRDTKGTSGKGYIARHMPRDEKGGTYGQTSGRQGQVLPPTFVIMIIANTSC